MPVHRPSGPNAVRMWVMLFLFQLAILNALLSENRRAYHKDLRFWISITCLGVTAALAL